MPHRSRHWLLLLLMACALPVHAQPLRLNEIQALGSHNSYRKPTDPKIRRMAERFSPALPADYQPSGWDYAHAPLAAQLELHRMRSFELDIYPDPEGGRYAKPAGRLLTLRRRALADPAWRQPGFKLMHIADFDYETHHVLLRDALAAIHAWSAAHPRHLPVFIMIEPKSFGVSSIAKTWPFTPLHPFGQADWAALEAEIAGIWGEDLPNVLTPARLRGRHPDIRTALARDGWPLLDEMRGHVVLVGMLDEAERQAYAQAGGEAMFCFLPPSHPEAAFVKIDDPVAHEDSIRTLVRRGLIVRTRTDADTREARAGDRTRLDAALRSGAQILSTDYYLPASWTGFRAALPTDAPAIVNGVLRPGLEKQAVQE